MKNYLIVLIFVFLQSMLIAQVGINNGNSQPAPDAMLDVSSIEKGILIPRMTLEQRDSISAVSNGLLVYLTDLEVFSFYNGAEWQNLAEGGYKDKIIDADEDTSVELLEKEAEDVIKFFQEGEESLKLKNDWDDT